MAEAATTCTSELEERRVDGGIKKKTEIKDVQQVVDETAGNTEEVQEWWPAKTAIIAHYLKCNLLKIGIPRDGTVEAIKDSIGRGNKHAAARAKCWDHILREVSDIAGMKIADVAYDTEGVDSGVRTVALVAKNVKTVEMGCDPIAFGDDASEEPEAAGPEGDTQSSSAKSEEITPQESAAPPASPCVEAAETRKGKVDLKAMTMMERQALWLQKKASKAKTAQQEANQRELSEMTGRPKINTKDGSSASISGTPSKSKSLRRASAGATSTSSSNTGSSSREVSRLREEIAALKSENTGLRKEAREIRRASNSSTPASNSTSSKRRNSTSSTKNSKLDKELSEVSGLKNRLRSNVAQARTKVKSGKENQTGPETEEASPTLSEEEQQRLHYLAEMARERAERKKSKQLKAKMSGDARVQVGGQSSATVGSPAGSPATGNQTESPSNSGVLGEVDTNSSNSNSTLKLPDIRKSSDMGSASEFLSNAKAEAALKAASAAKRTNDFAFDKTSTEDQGKYQIRNTDNFHINSIFKKRDTGRGCQAQRGVTLVMGTREDNGQQQALSLIFNKDLFDEEKAGQWWEENGHRFLSPKKRAQQAN